MRRRRIQWTRATPRRYSVPAARARRVGRFGRPGRGARPRRDGSKDTRRVLISQRRAPSPRGGAAASRGSLEASGSARRPSAGTDQRRLSASARVFAAPRRATRAASEKTRRSRRTRPPSPEPPRAAASPRPRAATPRARRRARLRASGSGSGVSRFRGRGPRPRAARPTARASAYPVVSRARSAARRRLRGRRPETSGHPRMSPNHVASMFRDFAPRCAP